MTELKPCPFCGKKPVFVEKEDIFTAQSKSVKFVLYCSNCCYEYGKRSLLEIRFDLTCDEGLVKICDEREDLIETWNRRAEND